MKTMLSVDGEKIIRVSDEKASKLYEEGFRFIPKSIWKDKVRDIDKPTEKEPTKNKANKMSRATKRHLRKSNK